MARIIVDDNLMQWEVYSSGGRFGLPARPKVVFHCLSDLGVRGRYVVMQGDEADAEAAVRDFPQERLRELLREAKALP